MLEASRLKVAAAHLAPIFHDTAKTIDKACDAIAEAAKQGVRIIAFPESFVPGYPMWSALASPIDTHRYFAELSSQSIRIDGPEIQRLRRVAREHEIIVSMGFTEGTDVSAGCLWNSNVLIGADGAILCHHRKIVPTYFEKLVWARGDGAGLRVSNTDVGRIGMLICGENGNPLARYSLIAQGEQIHISSYPAVSVTRPLKETGGFDLEKAIQIRAAGHSFEGKVFNIVAATYYDETLRDAMRPLGDETVELMDKAPKAASMIVGPSGEVVGSTLCSDEGLCIAEIDLSTAVELKRLHDIAGYYNRFDIFRVEVNRIPQHPIYFEDAPGAAGAERPGPQPESPAVESHLSRARKNRIYDSRVYDAAVDGAEDVGE